MIRRLIPCEDKEVTTIASSNAMDQQVDKGDDWYARTAITGFMEVRATRVISLIPPIDSFCPVSFLSFHQKLLPQSAAHDAESRPIVLQSRV